VFPVEIEKPAERAPSIMGAFLDKFFKSLKETTCCRALGCRGRQSAAVWDALLRLAREQSFVRRQ
jgi:hypothetical protein